LPAIPSLAVAALLGAAGTLSANTLPVASDAKTTVEPGASVAVTFGATDVDGNLLDIIITGLPTKGTVWVGSTALDSTSLPYTIPGHAAAASYTSVTGDHGDQTIKFKANDGTGDSNAATVTVRINLAPAASAITTFYTTPSTDLKVTLPATDPDGDTLTYKVTSLPGHGRLLNGTTALGDTDIPFSTSKNTITFSPDAMFHGQDSFTFTATDGYATSEPIDVIVQVNTTPVPDAIATSVLPDGTKSITLTSTDADRDPVQYIIASLPAHGTLATEASPIAEADLPVVLAQGVDTVKYTVDTGYRGTDSFHYRVKDAVSQSTRVAVTIAVNTPPVAPSFTIPISGQGNFVLTPTDAEGDALTVRITRLPAGALKVGGKAATKVDTVYTLTGADLAISYTVPTGTATTDSFEWIASDGHDQSAPGVVTLLLTSAPSSTTDPPATQPATDTTGSSTTDTTSTTDTSSPACGGIGAGGLILAAAMVNWVVISKRRRRSPRPRRDLNRIK
jgi:large repetitive protein